MTGKTESQNAKKPARISPFFYVCMVVGILAMSMLVSCGDSQLAAGLELGPVLAYVIFVMFPLFLFIICIPVAQKILKDGRKTILDYGCRGFGIVSIVAGTLTICLSHYFGLLNRLLFGLNPYTIYEPVDNVLVSCVLLALMGINFATCGVCIGKNVKCNFGFFVSILGLVYNLAIFIFFSWNVWVGKISYYLND